MFGATSPEALPQADLLRPVGPNRNGDIPAIWIILMRTPLTGGGRLRFQRPRFRTGALHFAQSQKYRRGTR